MIARAGTFGPRDDRKLHVAGGVTCHEHARYVAAALLIADHPFLLEALAAISCGCRDKQLAMAMFIFIYLGRPSATKIENMAHYTKEAPAPALPPGQLQPN